MFKSRQKEKLVSVILPVYNAEKTLKKALNSIINQTYKNIEVICINDGSTDTSSVILSVYKNKDHRIKIFSNNENKGIAYSRNYALNIAKGKYIMWCDADDWFEQDMIKKLVEPMETTPVDFAMCQTRIINDENLKERLLLEKIKYAINIPDGNIHSLDEKTFLDFSCVIWNKIFRKSIIDKYDIKCSLTSYAEDEAFVFKYLAVSQYYYCVHEKLYNYFRNESGITAERIYKRNSDALNAVDDVSKFIHKYKIKKYYDISTQLLAAKQVYYADLLEKTTDIQLSALQNKIEKSNTEKKKILDIFYTISDDYVEPLICSMTSVVKNANDNDVLNFHIIYNEIKNIEYIKDKLCFSNSNVEFIKLSDKQINRLGRLKNDVSTYKYFIPEIANGLEKCLYLDADTIITSSLSKLYDTQLKKNYVGVCEQAMDKEEKIQIIKLINANNYFNSGVMIMNIPLMKQDDITNKLIYARKNLENYLKNPTNDVLNLIVDGKFKLIELTYNLQTELYETLNPFFCYANDEVKFAMEKPVIIHYSGTKKPWNSVSPHMYKEEYFKYLRISPKNHLCYWKNV